MTMTTETVQAKEVTCGDLILYGGVLVRVVGTDGDAYQRRFHIEFPTLEIGRYDAVERVVDVTEIEDEK